MKVWTVYDGASNPIHKQADFIYVNAQGDLCGYRRTIVSLTEKSDTLLWAFKVGYWTYVYSSEDAAVLKSKTPAPRAN